MFGKRARAPALRIFSRSTSLTLSGFRQQRIEMFTAELSSNDNDFVINPF